MSFESTELLNEFCKWGRGSSYSKLKFLYDLLERTEETTNTARESLHLIECHKAELKPENVIAEIAIYKHVESASIDFAKSIRELLTHLEEECHE